MNILNGVSSETYLYHGVKLVHSIVDQALDHDQHDRGILDAVCTVIDFHLEYEPNDTISDGTERMRRLLHTARALACGPGYSGQVLAWIGDMIDDGILGGESNVVDDRWQDSDAEYVSNLGYRVDDPITPYEFESIEQFIDRVFNTMQRENKKALFIVFNGIWLHVDTTIDDKAIILARYQAYAQECGIL